MKNTKLEISELRKVEKDQNFMDVLVDNIQLLRVQKGWSVRELAERADLPFDSLQGVLKKKNSSCKYTTFMKLCMALEVEPSDLCGLTFMDPKTTATLSMSKQLKEHHRERIRAYTARIYNLFYEENDSNKQISILTPDCKNGFLKPTDVVNPLSISHLDKHIRDEVNVAVKIPCWHYDPYFRKGEILLLGTHRSGLNGETCVIYKGENMYICRKKIETINGQRKVSYISLIDGHTNMFTADEITYKVGYVVGFLYPDGEWGLR